MSIFIGRRGSGHGGSVSNLAFMAKEAVLSECPQHKFKWDVHKFGGSSVKDAASMRKCADNLDKAREGYTSDETRQGVVVSAMAGITDALLELVRKARSRENDYREFLDVIIHRHRACLDELLEDSPKLRQGILELLKLDADKIEQVLRAIYLTASATEFLEELISGYGEVWSAQIFNALLKHRGLRSDWVDAGEVLFVEPNQQRASMTPEINWDRSADELNSWFRSRYPADFDAVVITGFVATTAELTRTTLKRNGSDYSGSIFGALLHATQVTIWTDVDGVYSADPRKVPDALLIPKMSYTEAGEFSFYGAKIIHPKTMLPAIRQQVPVWIRNTFNPTCTGTLIHSSSPADGSEPNSPAMSRRLSGSPPAVIGDVPSSVIMGFCTIENLSLIMVRGGVTGSLEYAPLGVRERLLGSLGNVNVPLVLTAQAAPEHSLCFCVPKAHGPAALARIEEDFADDLKNGSILPVRLLQSDYTIITGVGDRVSRTPGVAACFFSALSRAKVNVLGVAQNGERVICVVVESQNAVAGLRALHATFKIPQRSVALALVGAGHLGNELIRELCPGHLPCLAQTGIDINLRGVTNQARMMLSDTITQDVWERAVATGDGLEPKEWGKLLKHINATPARHKIIIDCSASPGVAALYPQFLRNGIHVLSCNKHVVLNKSDVLGTSPAPGTPSNGTDSAAYETHLWYDAALGGGAPLAKTLRQLVAIGDEIVEVEASPSGTWSYILNRIAPATVSGNSEEEAAIPPRFSSAACDCYSLGLFEPDPRSDLSGRDAANVMSLISHICGEPILSDGVQVDMPLSGQLAECGTLADLQRVTAQYDAQLASLVADAAETDKVPRLIATYRAGSGCRVAIESVPRTHPLAQLDDSQTAFVVRTKRNPGGILLQGPCAGSAPMVEAIYSDLMRLVRVAFTKAQVR